MAQKRSRPSSLVLRAQTLLSLFRFLKENGKWWLIPMVTLLMATAFLLAAVQAIEYAAPFVYTIF